MQQVKPVFTKIQMLLLNQHKNHLADGGQLNIKTLYFKLYRVCTESMHKETYANNFKSQTANKDKQGQTLISLFW